MDDLVKQHTVPPEWAGERVDKAAAALFAEFSRSELNFWLKSGELTLDGQACKPKTKLVGGELLSLHARPRERESWESAQQLDFSIVFEDEHIIVIDKPAGLVVHPGAGNPDGTLVNGLLHHREALKLLPRAGVVHRLDKDTSGLMVVAASQLGLQRLSEQVREKSMHRKYLAIAEGRMVAGQDVDAPIGRHPQQRTRQAIRDDGKPAQTRFRVEQRFRAHTLVAAELFTGRTHQIRVHLQSIGYPLVGDSRYGARRRLPAGANPELVALLQHFPRQALHAYELTFQHPEDFASVAFETPMPEDMQQLVEALAVDAE